MPKGGTDLVVMHDGLPSGGAPADNETGWRMALAKLAARVEKDPGSERVVGGPTDPRS